MAKWGLGGLFDALAGATSRSNDDLFAKWLGRAGVSPATWPFLVVGMYGYDGATSPLEPVRRRG